VFVPGYYTECALISIQAKQLGLTVPLFGGDGWESSVLFEIGGAAVEGNYLSTHYHPSVGSDRSRRFVENYRQRWNGKMPDALAACGYDSALVLAATRNFPAVTGTITINENRDATKSAVILRIQGGQYEYLETVEP
jgi:branched-chain amino acid transport system substrate-binding protein